MLRPIFETYDNLTLTEDVFRQIGSATCRLTRWSTTVIALALRAARLSPTDAIRHE